MGFRSRRPLARAATLCAAVLLWPATTPAQAQWGSRSYEEERSEYFALVKQLEREANQLLSRIRQINNNSEAFLGRYSEQERHELVQKYEAGDDYRNRHRLLDLRLEQERDSRDLYEDARKALESADEQRPEVRADLWTKHIAWRRARVEARQAQLALVDSRLVVMQGEVGIDWEAFWADNAEDVLSVYEQVIERYPEDVAGCLMSVASTQLGSYFGGRLGPEALVEPAPVPIVPNLLLKVGKDCVVGAGFKALVNAFEAAWRKQFLDAMRDHGVMEGVAEYWWKEVILAELPEDDALLERLKSFVAGEAEQTLNETIKTSLGQGLTRYVAERELPELKRRYGSLIAAASKADMRRQMLSSAQQQAEDRLGELTQSASLLVDYTQKAAELYHNSRTFARIESNELARYRRVVECLRSEQREVTASAVIAELSRGAADYASFVATCGLVEVPAMNGLLVAGARKLLEARGLVAREQQDVAANPDPSNDGRVKEHRPGSRKKVPRGTEVTLVVWAPFGEIPPCTRVGAAFTGALARAELGEARRLLDEMRGLGCEDVRRDAGLLDAAEAEQRDAQRTPLPTVVGLDVLQAHQILRQAGFRLAGNHFEKTSDAGLGGKVRSQEPREGTLLVEGAAVELTSWQFDEEMAESEAKCSAVRGSQARWNSEAGRVECVCTQGVRFRTRQMGEYCAGCGEIKVLFDRELANGNRAGAQRLLDLVAGQCGWHEDGHIQIDRSEQREQAEQACRNSKPGSRAVARVDGYACECPQGSVEADLGRGVSCQSCDAMKTHFDSEIREGDGAGAQALLSLSSTCGWHAGGQMALGQLSQQSQQAQAQASCTRLVPGSQAARSGSEYLCVCPTGTVQMLPPRPGCVSCAEAEAAFDGALQQADRSLGGLILNQSYACGWYGRGWHALNSPQPPPQSGPAPAPPGARPPGGPYPGVSQAPQPGAAEGSGRIDVTGTWLFTYSSPRRDLGLGIVAGGTGSFTGDLEQRGSSVTGTLYGPDGGSVRLSGTVSGSSITIGVQGAQAWESAAGTVGPGSDRMGGRFRTSRSSATADGTWSAVRQGQATRPHSAAPAHNPECARLAREYYDHCANKREREWNSVFSRAQSLGCTELDPMRCFKLQFELDVPPIEEAVPPMQPVVRPPS